MGEGAVITDSAVLLAFLVLRPLRDVLSILTTRASTQEE